MGTAAIDLFRASDPESQEELTPASLSVVENTDPDTAAFRDIRAYDRDVDLPNLQLEGKTADAVLTDAILSGDMTLTIEGASTITLNCNDPLRKLTRSGILRAGAVINIDELQFALVHINRSGANVTLTFEDLEVNELRKHDKPKKAFRDKVTRAEFILSLIREVKNRTIKYIIPELHVKQKIAPVDKQTLESARLDNHGKGIHVNNHHLTAKGHKATQAQIKVANHVLDVGFSKNATYKVLISGIEAAITESTLSNPKGGDGDSVGTFQQTKRSYPNINRHNIDESAGAYFDQAMEVAKQNPNFKAWEIAAAVQRPRSDLRKRYDAWHNEATAFVRAYGGSGEGGSSYTRFKRFAFSRGQNGKREDSWSCIQRLAQDVNWRAFMWHGTFFYISEEDLFAQQPRMHIRSGIDGVDWIDYDYDTGKVTSECTVTCRFNRWIAPPGTVVVIEGEGKPIDGKWLVHELNRGFFDKNGTITLKKPSRSLLETAPDVEQVQLDQAVGSSVDRAYSRAQTIHEKHLPYSWGGGHSKFGPTYGIGRGASIFGEDCSGAVSDVLHAGGMLSKAPLDSGKLMKWGHPGKGKHMTVYASPDHTFIEFHMPGKKTEHWGTGDWGKGWNGPGFNKHLHPHDGFVARHWVDEGPKLSPDDPGLQPFPLPPLFPPNIKWPQIPALPPTVKPPPLTDDNPIGNPFDPNQNLDPNLALPPDEFTDF